MTTEFRTVSVEWLEGLLKIAKEYEQTVDQYWEDGKPIKPIMKSSELSGYAKSAKYIIGQTEDVTDKTGNGGC